MKHMTSLKTLALTALLALATAQSTLANEPKNSTPLAGQEVIDLYLGKTWTWSKGGAYLGSGGAFEAIWKDSVGIGKWYATNKGQLCYEAQWSLGGEPDKQCSLHVYDEDGVVWKKDDLDDKEEWYKATKQFSERMASGNKIKRTVSQRLKKEGRTR